MVAGMKKNFKDVRRRIKQQALQTLGVVESTEDTQFKEEYLEFKNTCRQINSLKKSMADHLEAVRRMQASSAALSIELAAFHQNTKAAKATVAYGKAHAETERVQLASIERIYEDDIKGATDLLLWQVPEIEEKVRQRRKLLLDYDAHSRKYENITKSVNDRNEDTKPKKKLPFTRRKSESEIAVEMAQRKVKLEQAEEAVDSATKWLLEQFHDLEDKRSEGLLLQGPMSALVSCELHLMNKTAERLENLKSMFDSVDMFSATLAQYDKEPAKSNTFDVEGVAHITNLRSSKRKRLPKEGQVFGVALESSTPVIVCDCIAYVRENGIETEGIFRIPGETGVVDSLRERYDTGELGVLASAENKISVHDVCTLFKSWFRELEEPLIPTSKYCVLMGLLRDDLNFDNPSTVKEVVSFTHDLPEKHRLLLGFLANFLLEITTHAEENKMTAGNLATCFAPSIMRAPEETPAHQVLVDMQAAIAAVKVFILHAKELQMPKAKQIASNTHI